MSFGQAIKSFLSKYASFSGRAPRSEYWFAVLFIFLVSAATGIVDQAMGTPLLQGLFGLAMFLPSISVQVRRLHDIGRSGWWILGLFCPGGFLFGLGLGMSNPAALSSGGPAATFITLGIVATLASYVLLLVWLCTRGTQGPNRYGADPLGHDFQKYVPVR